MISAPDKLPATLKALMEAGENEIFLSSVSGWEIAIKYQINKLKLPDKPDLYIPLQLEKYFIEILPVEMDHALNVFHLPDIHKDPFDRLLISQSQLEGLPLVTDDSMIKKYDVETIWD